MLMTTLAFALAIASAVATIPIRLSLWLGRGGEKSVELLLGGIWVVVLGLL